jgi:hypothetical protein
MFNSDFAYQFSRLDIDEISTERFLELPSLRLRKGVRFEDTTRETKDESETVSQASSSKADGTLARLRKQFKENKT